MKKTNKFPILLVFIFFYAVLPFFIFQTGGLDSGFVGFFVVAPLAVTLISESTIFSVFAAVVSFAEIVILLVVERAAFYPINKPVTQDIEQIFFLEVFFSSMVATLLILFIAWKFSEKMKLANEKLVESKRLSSMATLANGIAHEVNNPLTIIKMRSSVITERMTEKLTDEDNANWIDQQIIGIEHAVMRIKGIMQNLSLVASIDMHREENRGQSEFDLKEMIARLAQKKDVEMRFKLQEKSFIILGNSELFERCLKELLDNADFAARKDVFSSTIKPWISVELEQKSNFAILTISNCGKPLSKDVQAKIFDPFFSTKDVGEGVGLGLSICKAIIEMHGGVIGYNSHAKNPEFIVRVPMKSAV